MKAIVYERYGSPDVLELKDVEKPVPGDHEVLIKTFATTVTTGDIGVRSLNVPSGFKLMSRLFFGVTKPRRQILGAELSGEIEAVGKNVSMFRIGDRVFAFTGAKMGCYTEYKCIAETDSLAIMPPNLTFEEAAALSFGGTTVLNFFRRGKLKSGERILINGASGGVGTAAVQIAKHIGAEITGVCSASNIELVRSLGAAHVIDYTKEDFTQNGEKYDVIVDTVGTAPFDRCRNSLKERGRFFLVIGSLLQLLQIPWVSVTSDKRIIGGPASERVEDLQSLAKLAKDGVYKPVIDRSYPFHQIAEAHRYVDGGHKRGNVVITIAA